VPEPGLRRWRLLIAYDGSGFRGFAAQPAAPTVAGALADAIARSARLADPPPIVCAGRTDAGVHARGQVAHVDLPADLPAAYDLKKAVNRQLAPAVVVRAAAPAGEGFDARHSATARHYRYLVVNAPVPDPLLAPLAWHVADPLDRRAMTAAADALVGEHDFRGFCRRPPGSGADEPIVRRVTSAGWSTGPCTLLRFDISASSFCHQMVRSLVGALVAVGRGRGNVATMVAQLRAGTRTGAAQPAPPHGLCLESVSYPEP
jgi:tRNA pseudouridine38-40 synthase